MVERQSNQTAATFEAQLRDALLHLYDPAHLLTHDLTRYVDAPPNSSPSVRGKLLRQALLDAIEALRPAPATPAESLAWRTYRLLELRYVGGLSATEVLAEIGISKSQYQRDHTNALSALATLLRGRWRIASAEDVLPNENPPRAALALSETAELTSHMSYDYIHVGATLGELLPLLRPLSDQNGIELTLVAPNNLPAVRADRVILRQAVLALLGNLLAGSANGSLIISVSSRDQMVEVAIERLPSRQHTSGAQAAESVSLETEVARRLIEALGGTLVVERAVSIRSWRARITLPVARRPTLLVVDNSADFIELVARYLSESAWQVIGAHDVSQALALARASPPTVVLLDVMMPGQDGWDLLLSFKATSEMASLPVIICSVLYEPQMARAAGAVEYLTKPVSQSSLLEALAPWAARGLAPAPSP